MPACSLALCSACNQIVNGGGAAASDYAISGNGRSVSARRKLASNGVDPKLRLVRTSSVYCPQFPAG